MSQNQQPEPECGSSAPTDKVSRHRLLMWASTFLGVPDLATALGIEDRSLRAKLSGDRGVSDTDLRLARTALERRARAIDGLHAAISDHLNPSKEAPCPTA